MPQLLRNTHYDVIACMVVQRTEFEAIERALASVLDGTLSVGVVLIDDGSGEGYVEALEDAFGGLAAVTSLGARRGVAAAYNHALMQLPPSDVLLCMSPHVALQDGALDKLHQQISCDHNTGLLAPQLQTTEGQTCWLNRRRPTVLDIAYRHGLPAALQTISPIKERVEYYQMRDVGYDTHCAVEYLNGNVLCFKRSIIERLGGFDAGFGDYFYDADITLRAGALAKALYYPKASAIRYPDPAPKGLHHLWDYLSSLLRFFIVWGVKWA